MTISPSSKGGEGSSSSSAFIIQLSLPAAGLLRTVRLAGPTYTNPRLFLFKKLDLAVCFRLNLDFMLSFLSLSRARIFLDTFTFFFYSFRLGKEVRNLCALMCALFCHLCT